MARMRRAWWLKLAMTAGLLWAVLARTKLAEIWTVLAAARLGLVLVGIGLVLLGRVVAAVRMKILTDRQRMSLTVPQLFAISCIASFYGLALPGTLAGGAVRWHRLSRKGRTLVRSLAAILLDRLLDTVALVGCGLGFWFVGTRAGAHATFGWLLGALLAGLVLATHLLLHPRVMLAVWGRLERLPMPAWLWGRLRQFQEALRRYHALPGRVVRQLLLLSVARHLIGAAGLLAFAQALHLSLSWMHVGWIRSLMMIIAMLPISLAGFGVREAGAVFLLGLYEVPASAAVAWSLLSFTRTLVPAGLGALLEAYDACLSRADGGRRARRRLAPLAQATRVEPHLVMEEPS